MHYNTITTLLLCALLCAPAATAQRKRTATRTSTATAAKAKPAASGRWAVLGLGNSLAFLEMDDRNLYFKYEYDDKNVYAIDKRTGQVSTLIKYVPNYDDDAVNMEVTGLGSCHDTLYLATAGARVYEYNGTDLATSRKILDSPKSTEYYVRFAFSADGRQMAARGVSWSGNAYVAQLNRETGKGVRGYGRNNSYRMLIDPKYRLWTQSLGSVDIVTDHSAKAEAAATYTTEDGSLGDRSRYMGDQAMCYLPDSHTVLVASGRKVYATSDSTVAWREVAKLPSDCPAQKIAILVSNGRLTYGFTDEVNHRIVCWNGGLDTTPTIIPQIASDVERDNMFTPLWSTNGMPIDHQTMLDSDGNLYMVVDGKLWIYNPDGIVGFSELKGRYAEHKMAR